MSGEGRGDSVGARPLATTARRCGLADAAPLDLVLLAGEALPPPKAASTAEALVRSCWPEVGRLKPCLPSRLARACCALVSFFNFRQACGAADEARVEKRWRAAATYRPAGELRYNLLAVEEGMAKGRAVGARLPSATLQVAPLSGGLLPLLLSFPIPAHALLLEAALLFLNLTEESTA